MKKLFTQFENYAAFEKRHNNILAVIESILMILGSAFIGSAISSEPFNARDFWFGATLGAVSLYLFIRRLIKETNFTTSAIGELKSTIELNDRIKEVERKNIINDYIDDAIKALNSNTCNYQEGNAENFLCDQSVDIGLKAVFSPFFYNPQNILSTAKSRFTVGAYINSFRKLPVDYKTVPSIALSDHGVMIGRDDLNMGSFFIKDQLTDHNQRDLPFYFQTKIQDSYKHHRFIQEPLQLDDGRTFSLIIAPIPNVCEDAIIGVFFIISEFIPTIPSDFEDLVKIFGRLFSNWLSKYNDCVDKRCEQARTQLKTQPVITPPEVIKLNLNNSNS